jgi:hypothetical protein
MHFRKKEAGGRAWLTIGTSACRCACKMTFREALYLVVDAHLGMSECNLVFGWEMDLARSR